MPPPMMRTTLEAKKAIAWTSTWTTWMSTIRTSRASICRIHTPRSSSIRYISEPLRPVPRSAQSE